MLYIFDMGGVVTTTAAVVEKIALILGITEAEFMSICGCPEGNRSYGKPHERAAGDNGFNLITMYSNGLLSAKEFWRLFSARSGIAVTTDWWHFLFHPEPNENIRQLIGGLKKRGERVVCGTNTIESHYLNHLERGDYSIFDQTYASCFMGVSKPDVNFWKIILTAEDVEAKDAFFVDDRIENCEAAASLGINTFHFDFADGKNGSDCISALKKAVGLD